jgi:hypothetical protein
VVLDPKEIADPEGGADVFIGPSYPTHNYDFSGTVNFLRSFTLYAALSEGAGGHYAFNGTGRQQQGSNRFHWPVCQVDNPETQNAFWRAQCENVEWTAYIVPADYFKLRTVSLTYQMPEGLIPRAAQSSLTLAVNNPWKWTDYPGLDPEITAGRPDAG